MTSFYQKGRLTAFIFAAVILCTGCDSYSPTVGAGLPVGSIHVAMAQTTGTATEEHLPTIPQASLSDCVSLLPEQPIYTDDDTARLLAYQITQYCGPDGVLIPEFSDRLPLDDSAALKTALYHTGPVLLPVEYSVETGEYICPAYPDHQLFQLFLQQSEPCEFFYQEEAMAKVTELFGDDFLLSSQPFVNLSPFTYYAEEEVFAKPMEDLSGMIPCPVILSWSESENLIRVSALMGESQGAGCPIMVDGIACTVENVEALKAHTPLHSFTFERQDDGRLALKGYQVVSLASNI